VLAPTITLTHGAVMPQLGLGTWPLDDAGVEAALVTAIEAGYRLVDTAENYRNEAGVGRGIRASGIAREAMFITTKFNKKWHGRDLVGEAFERSSELMGVDYIDLLLIHWPNPRLNRYVEAWEGLIGLLADGCVRAIGVSNFRPEHLDQIIKATGVVPDVNQIQLSPAITQADARAYADEHGIVIESWAPIGGQGPSVLNHAPLIEIAARYGKTPAQVALRWHIELGLVTVPKSGDPQRIRENIDIFDFTLTPAEVAAISAIDVGAGESFDYQTAGH
jgi:2,5-diketo-D-gluconate reductase A